MRFVKRALKIIGTLVIVIIGMLYFFQEKLIFNSKSIPQDYKYQFTSNFEEFYLNAPDGAILNGIHFKQKDPKGVVLYCHGNTGELPEWGKWAEEFSKTYNYDVVVWDYRGYGKSTGKRRQKRMLNDGFLFYDYCKKHFSAENITVYGRSLGGFFATHIIKNKIVGRLVLESTPMSLLKIAQQEYPFLPSKYLLKYRFQNSQNIKNISVPTFIIHGTQDILIPYENGVGLYKLAKAKTKRLFTIQGGDHNDLESFGEIYFGALKEIFNVEIFPSIPE